MVLATRPRKMDFLSLTSDVSPRCGRSDLSMMLSTFFALYSLACPVANLRSRNRMASSVVYIPLGG